MLPPRYVRLDPDRGGAEWVVWEGAAEEVTEVSRRFGSLRSWALDAATETLTGGRGPAWVVPALAAGPGASSEWVVRPFRRGGWARWLDDRYPGRGRRSRAVRQLHVTASARAAGVPTPAAVVAATYPDGVVYRADLATERVPGEPIADLLLRGDAETARAALERVGRFVRELAELGLDHPDLNAANLLCEGEGSGRLWVVDLDGAAMRPESPPGPRGERMFTRLVRSLRKWERRTDRRLGEEEVRALVHGFREATGS